MATQITNKATLNYNSGSDLLSTSSNTAVVTMQGPLEVSKYSLENSYRVGDEITYNIFITNTSANTLTTLTIEDDLGTYAFNDTMNVTPLTYINPAKVFINNVYSGTVNGVVSAEGDQVSFTINTLLPDAKLLLQYEAAVNEYAGAIIGTSNIDNIVSATAAGVASPVIATNVLPVASYADVSIEKTMFPDPVVDGSTLTYTFDISNYGTIPATNVVLQDAFTTLPTITSVTVDGVVLFSTDYSYAEGVFQYPATGAATPYEIPAATFTQDPATGVVGVTPSTSTIIITGTI